MKDIILSKIKELAERLNRKGVIFTSADLVDELKECGIVEDSFNVVSLVWEAYHKYGNSEAIKNAFVNNRQNKSLVEEYRLWDSLDERNNDEALSILHQQSEVTENALTKLNEAIELPQTQIKEKPIVDIINKLSGTANIKKTQHEAEQLFIQYSKIVKAYEDAQNEVKNSISTFVELREHISQIYRQYAMMLVDVFGDSVTVTFPELFDFDLISYLDTQAMSSLIQLEYTTLTSSCSEMLSEVSESFKQSLQGAVVAYKGNKGKSGNKATLIVAAMNMLSHYMDTNQKAMTIKRALIDLKKASNHDKTMIVGDIGRLSLIHKNINEVLVPKAEVFLRYGEELLSDDFTNIGNALYSNEIIKGLKEQRDNLLNETKNIEQELKYIQLNIDYYKNHIIESETLLKSMKDSYEKALKNKPIKPSLIKKLLTFGQATTTYNRDIYEWRDVSFPLIERYEDLMVELRMAQEELNTLQGSHKKYIDRYNKIKNEIEALATKIKREIIVDDNLKEEILNYLKPMILLLKAGKDVIGGKIDSAVVNTIEIDRYKAQLLSSDTIDKMRMVYDKISRSKTTENVKDEKNPQQECINKCIPLIEEIVKLNLKKEEGSMAEDFYNGEFERLRQQFNPILSSINNQIETLREAMKQVNVATNNSDLKKSILNLVNIDENEIADQDWEEFLLGNKTIEI